jgi:hypothetical protein
MVDRPVLPGTTELEARARSFVRDGDAPRVRHLLWGYNPWHPTSSRRPRALRGTPGRQ